MSPYTTPRAPSASLAASELCFLPVLPLSCASAGSPAGVVALASLIRWLATPDGVVGEDYARECISATFPFCSIAVDSSGSGPRAANLWTPKEPTRATLRVCMSQVFAPVRGADLRGRQTFLPRLPVEGSDRKSTRLNSSH